MFLHLFRRQFNLKGAKENELAEIPTRAGVYPVVDCAAVLITAAATAHDKSDVRDVVTGPNAFTDYKQEKPGIFRKITVADLPQPYATKSSPNSPTRGERPEGAWPITLPGFKVNLYAEGLDHPRELRAAPNGDIFAAESDTGSVEVFAASRQRASSSRSQFSPPA